MSAADDRILLQAVAALAGRATACVDVVRTVDAEPDELELAADRLYRTARAAERISALIETPEVAAAAESGPMAVIRSCEADPAVVDWHCARSRDRYAEAFAR